MYSKLGKIINNIANKIYRDQNNQLPSLSGLNCGLYKILNGCVHNKIKLVKLDAKFMPERSTEILK